MHNQFHSSHTQYSIQFSKFTLNFFSKHNLPFNYYPVSGKFQSQTWNEILNSIKSESFIIQEDITDFTHFLKSQFFHSLNINKIKFLFALIMPPSWELKKQYIFFSNTEISLNKLSLLWPKHIPQTKIDWDTGSLKRRT